MEATKGQLDVLGGIFLPFSRMDAGATQPCTSLTSSFCGPGVLIYKTRSQHLEQPGRALLKRIQPLGPPQGLCSGSPGSWAPSLVQGFCILPLLQLREAHLRPCWRESSQKAIWNQTQEGPRSTQTAEKVHQHLTRVRRSGFKSPACPGTPLFH